jgi:peptidylprolyl isomerase
MNDRLVPPSGSRFGLVRGALVASWLLACARPCLPAADPAVGAAGAAPGAALQPAAAGASAQVPPGATLADVLATTTPDDFRSPDPENMLYLELDSGRVVLLLAPEFAPRHVANVKALVREGYFDGTAIVRVHENYVVQWADPDGKREIRTAQRTLPAEFDRPAAGLSFTPLAERDTYASEVGFSDGFPAARESMTGAAWLVHCYAMLGAGRDTAADSGGGTELYVVIGHSPRHLDRNVTLFGRVLSGMERLTSLPRGSGALGFYEKPEQRVPIRQMRVAADVPPAQRTELEILRTDTPAFAALVEARRNRREEWFLRPAGHIELCNVPLVVRPKRAAGG